VRLDIMVRLRLGGNFERRHTSFISSCEISFFTAATKSWEARDVIERGGRLVNLSFNRVDRSDSL
jgi:hypothetical protein